MPAWKNRDAGRRGRSRFDGYAPYDERATEHPRSRVERLTKTAASYGGGRQGYSGNAGSHPDEDLTAVADELDRMLSERSGKGRPTQGRGGRGQSAHKPRRSDELGGVMGALDRLDRRVQEFSDSGEYDEDYDDYDRGPDHAYDDEYQDYGDGYAYVDDHDDDFGHDNRRGRYEDSLPSRARKPSRQRRRDGHTRYPDESTRLFYEDLGRRIDALRMPQEDAMNKVREEIGSLRNALGGLSRGASKTVHRQNEELRRLSDMIERLRVDKKNDVLAREVRKEVSDLKGMLGRVNVEGTLHTLENGYAHIVERLDDLSRGAVDPHVLRGVTDRLSEIEEAFAALPRSEHMSVLEDRVVSIAGRLEDLLQRKEHTEIEPLRQELREVREFIEHIDVKSLIERIDERMKFVSCKLDDLETLAKEQRGLDTRLSAMEERIPEADTIASLQDRLEDIVGMMSGGRKESGNGGQLQQVDDRLNEIAARLERMEKAAPLVSDTPAFEILDQRLEQISAKIDTIEKSAGLNAASVSDNGDAGGVSDNPLLLQLQERLEDLNQRLEQPADGVTTGDLEKLREEIGAMRETAASPISAEALEQRIADLAQMLSSDSNGPDDTRFDQLSEKVSALASQIQNTSREAQDLSEVTTALDRIEDGLRQTRSDVVDIAKAAAKEAVQTQPAGATAKYDEAISALQGDLKLLLDAAEGSDERARNTFEGVKSVLGSLSDRLENLERSGFPVQGSSQAFEPPAAEETAQVLPIFAGGNTRGGDGSQTVSDEPRPKERTRDRKADFIAAARRAAQAASVEAAQLETAERESIVDAPDEERGKARKSWFRGLMRRKSGKDAETEAIAEEMPPRNEFEQPEPAEEEPVVLAGDRPAPEEKPATGGRRRRAILYTAAAVVLVIGALQVIRLAPFITVGNQVADNGNVEAPADPTAAAPSAANSSVSQAGDISEGSASSPGNLPSVAAGPASPINPSAVVHDGSAPPQIDGGAPEGNIAFAPPAQVSNGLSAEPPVIPGALSSGPALQGAQSGGEPGLIASLPPEAVGNMSLRTAAANGEPAAEFLVGVKYTEGDGVTADLAVAASWYKRAAEKGLAPAQYRLASLFEKGRGVERDIAKARDWYVRAAEAGNAKAMHNLAVLYAEGGGGAPDYNSAAKWFEAAANYGVKDSLFNLGILYAGGIGVQKDLVASYKWFAVAAEQGDPEASKRRDAVANQMDEKTLADARLAAETFRLKTPVEAANKVHMKPEWGSGAGIAPENASLSPEQLAFANLVREAQGRLNAMGFDTGSPDGQMGPKTRSAIRAFQRSLGLPETGEIDGLLMEELKGQSI